MKTYSSATVALGFVLSVAAAAAQTPQQAPAAPKSSAAVAADAKAQRALEAADAVWAKAVAEAKRQQVADLRNAQKAALSANNVEEATAIAKEVEALEADIAILSGRNLKVIVKANQDWQRLAVLPRGRYKIQATGRWSYDGKNWATANGIGPAFGGLKNAACLQVRLNEGSAVDVGEHGTVNAEQDGTALYMRMADYKFDDNAGELTVTITRY